MRIHKWHSSAAVDTPDIMVGNHINTKVLKKAVERGGRLTASAISYLLQRASEAMRVEDNVVRVASPAVLCGPTHGDADDSLKLLRRMRRHLGPMPRDSNFWLPVSTELRYRYFPNVARRAQFVFLGNYVCAQPRSLLWFLLLLAYKINLPNVFHLLRGRLETRCHSDALKTLLLSNGYPEELYESFVSTFRAMPIAAVIDQKMFCSHSGVAASAAHLGEVQAVNRFDEPADPGTPLCDLLSTQPAANFDCDSQSLPNVDPTRISFTRADLSRFLQANHLAGFVRADHALWHGFASLPASDTANDEHIPLMTSLVSCPNMLQHKTKGWFRDTVQRSRAAFAIFDGHKMNFVTFGASRPGRNNFKPHDEIN